MPLEGTLRVHHEYAIIFLALAMREKLQRRTLIRLRTGPCDAAQLAPLFDRLLPPSCT